MKNKGGPPMALAARSYAGCLRNAGERAEACARRDWTSTGVAIAERRAHGVDRNPGYDAREEEAGNANHDRKCARERLPRYNIAITNREAGDKGEIDRVADRPSPRQSQSAIPAMRPVRKSPETPIPIAMRTALTDRDTG